MNMFWITTVILCLSIVIAQEDVTLGINKLNLVLPVIIYTSTILSAEGEMQNIGYQLVKDCLRCLAI